MALEVSNSYSSYAAQNVVSSSKANDTKKKDAEQAVEKYGSSKAESTAESTAGYLSKLEKLAPSVEFGIGNTHSSAKSGKTLTINQKLLEKMQDDPNKEKEMKELIRGVESATKLLDSMHRASGWTVVYRHGYIDENGKYCKVF